MSTGRKERYEPEAYAQVMKDLAAGVTLASALGGPDRPGRTAFYQRLKEAQPLPASTKRPWNQSARVYVDKLLLESTRS